MQLNLLSIRLFKLLEKNKVKLVYYPLGFYWFLILALTSIPGAGMPEFGVSDKIEHFGAYFVLTILLQFTLYFQNKFPKAKVNYFLFSIFIAIIYGIFDELHQLLIPGRFFDLLDIIANSIGTMLGALLTNRIIKNSTNSQEKNL